MRKFPPYKVLLTIKNTLPITDKAHNATRVYKRIMLFDLGGIAVPFKVYIGLTILIATKKVKAKQ